MRFARNNSTSRPRYPAAANPRYHYQLSNGSSVNGRFRAHPSAMGRSEAAAAAATQPMLLMNRRRSWLSKTVSCLLFTLYVCFGLFTAAFVIGSFPLREYLFKSTFERSYQNYDTSLQPSYPSYIVYVIMYIWNLVWILWVFLYDLNICQKYIYFFPPVTGSLVAIEFLFGVSFLALSMELMDANQLYGKLWAVTMALFGFTSAYLAVGFKLQRQKNVLKHNFNTAFWLVKVVTQNGLGGLISLLLMETLFILHSILTDSFFGFASAFSTTVLLAALSLAIVCYFVIDILLVESVTRFVVLPYLAVASTLSCTVLSKSSFNAWENVIFLVVLVCTCTILTGVRILIGFFHEGKFISIRL